MKRISEVTKITGVSRRTLQEYDKMNLVNPSAKTEGGYWLYDDNAIKRIIFIQTFAEVGYARKKIKEILDSTDIDLSAEYDKVIKLLEEKRKRIDGMIRLVKRIKSDVELPQPLIQAFSQADMKKVIGDASYSESIKNYIDMDVEWTAEEEIELFMPFYYMFAIGLHSKSSPKEKVVQDCAYEFYKYYYDYLYGELENMDDDFHTEESVREFVEDMRNDYFDMNELVESQCGPGTIEYINTVLSVFADTVVERYWNNE